MPTAGSHSAASVEGHRSGEPDDPLASRVGQAGSGVDRPHSRCACGRTARAFRRQLGAVGGWVFAAGRKPDQPMDRHPGTRLRPRSAVLSDRTGPGDRKNRHPRSSISGSWAVAAHATGGRLFTSGSTMRTSTPRREATLSALIMLSMGNHASPRLPALPVGPVPPCRRPGGPGCRRGRGHRIRG